jgi:ABC-2 type transport system permease protein
VLIGGTWPTPGEVIRLLSFVGLAFFYMLIFLALSMLLSIQMKNNATVFLLSLVVWMLVSFVVPQLADTMMSNSTVINSISGTTNQIPQDTAVSQAINALSPTWYLRSMGRQLLEVAPGSQALGAGTLAGRWLGTLLALLAPSIVLVAIGYVTFLRDETLTIENGL